MKLLLVDDDVFLRDMYALKFKESGHSVEVADSPQRALSLVRQQADFDIIILDMIMPTMTGIELMQKIMSEFPDKKTKFIILSNHGQEEDVQEAKAAGAVGYIIKATVIPSEVVKRVESFSK